MSEIEDHEVLLHFTIIGEVVVSREALENFEKANGIESFCMHEEYLKYLLQNANRFFAHAKLNIVSCFDDKREEKDK